MNEAIKKGIAKAIKNEFGEKYKIYDDSVKQGIEKPCFFILGKKCTFDRMLGKRAAVTFHYEIELRDEDRESAEAALFRMFGALDMIETEEGKLFGRNMSFSSEKDKGIFSVDYRCTVMFEEENGEYMEYLERKDV